MLIKENISIENFKLKVVSVKMSNVLDFVCASKYLKLHLPQIQMVLYTKHSLFLKKKFCVSMDHMLSCTF